MKTLPAIGIGMALSICLVQAPIALAQDATDPDQGSDFGDTD